MKQSNKGTSCLGGTVLWPVQVDCPLLSGHWNCGDFTDVLLCSATATRELPQTPKQNKAPKGFKMVAGLDTIVIKDVKVGLRRVAKDVFDQKSSKRDSNAPDPSLGGVRSKATMFGQKMVPPTPLREPRTIIRDKVRGSTTSNTSNRSDSGVDVCDVMRDIAPQACELIFSITMSNSNTNS